MEGPKEAFLEFADRVNRDLDACGFPLCKGDIMARNPRWCLTLQEWRSVFDGWIRNNDPQALLHASIFFDFRSLAGEARLAGLLRESRARADEGERAFCRALAQAALETRPPLGLFAGLSGEEIDLEGAWRATVRRCGTRARAGRRVARDCDQRTPARRKRKRSAGSFRVHPVAAPAAGTQPCAPR